MNPEVKQYLEKSLKRPRFIDVIKHRFKLFKLTDSEINLMKGILIKDASPLFNDFWLNREKVNIINKLTVKCFKERIMTLPKKDIFGLYSELIELKKAKSEEAKALRLEHFMMNITLYYGREGWFLRRVFDFARTGK